MREPAGPRTTDVTCRSRVPASADLVGRDPELSTLDEVVTDLASGRGRSVWIDGEPGVGKTALLTELCGRVGRCAIALFTARAAEAADIFPLRVLLDALRVGPGSTDPDRAAIAERLWGRDGDDSPGTGNAVTAAAELLTVLVDRLCAAGPVMIVVDDMQWADETTLAVWGRLDEATRQLPLLLVAAARPVPRREEVDRLRRAVTAGGGAYLPLDPLADTDVHRLVERLAQAPPGPGLRALVRQAGGNPLYVRELVDALVRGSRVRRAEDGALDLDDADAAAPRSLAAAIGARLSFLSEPAMRVLRAATVLGAGFRLEHLALLVERSPLALVDVIEEALAAGVLTDADPDLAFRHALIRHALYESMPAAMRNALHRQAAQRLAEAGEPAELVVTQLQASPGPVSGWVVDWLLRAAPSVTTRAAGLAAELLRRVMAQVGDDDPRRSVLGMHLVDALFHLGDYEAVDAAVVPLLREATDVEVIGRMTWCHVVVLRALGRPVEALDLAVAALAADRLDARWRARVRAIQAVTLAGLGRFDEALTVARAAEADGERVPDRIAVAWALFAWSLATGISLGDSAGSLAEAERGLAILGDDPATVELHLLFQGLRVTALYNLNRTEEGARALGRALTLAERAGTPLRLAWLRVQAAEINFLMGRWDDALPELDAAAELLHRGAVVRGMLFGVGALIAANRGDDELIARYLAAAAAEPPTPDAAGMTDYVHAAQALVEERDGRPERALDRWLSLLDPDSTRCFPRLTPERCVFSATAVRIAVEVGRDEVARAAASACVAQAEERGDLVSLAAAEHCRGLVDQDPTRLLAAAAGFATVHQIHDQATALEDAASVLGRAGRLAEARAALEEALDRYADLDARWNSRRAEARLRDIGVRRGRRGTRRRRPVTGWEALTPTEVTVCRLVAAGRSNPEIATELYTSRNTVQTHVSHILAKLGCRSRTEIVALHRERGLPAGARRDRAPADPQQR
ncbi:AAA family ATPase [Micromonospora sp. NPDC049240]|uniref:helix-turn-helix transcriptional regulator n=1 Tax=Micromonospora sp. NPDC049240 TaxID=3155151 RepID=UPI003409E7F7